MTGVVSRCTKPSLGMIVMVAVSRMGFNGSRFPVDRESVPRVASLSYRNSISVRDRADAQLITEPINEESI